MLVKPWDIYASELLPIGYGHPLWRPEPNSSGREVFIGDVGWLKTGAFRALFNSMQDADHPINQEKGVPQDFQVFCPPNLSIEKSDKITQGTVFSRSISTKKARADMAAVGPSSVGPISAGVGWRFQTRSDAGAFVMFNPPGVAQEIESKRHIVNYMRDHFDSWLEFANSSKRWGLGLRPEDIIFVCETLKTTEWAVAAFQGSMFRDQEGSVSGQFGSFGSAGFSVHISEQLLPTSHYRSGPPRPTATAGEEDHLLGSGDDTPAAVSPDPNQCLFVHYYKMKRRLLWSLPMRASAGPHQLPPGPDNVDQDAPMIRGDPSTYEFESEPVHDDAYDPVTHLLNYVLETSEADIAIASDLDLIALFRGRVFPYDVAEAIVQLSPSVEVDENGVGTICVDYDFVRDPSVGDEQIGEDDLVPEAKLGGHHESMPQDSPPMGDHPSNPQHAYGDSNLADLSSAGRVHYPMGMEDTPPPRIPPSMQAPTQAVAPPSQSAAYPLAFPPQGETNPLQIPDHDDQTMAIPGDTPWDMRPGWGAPTSVHDGSVSALAYTADGKYLASGSEDATIIIWDALSNTAWHRAPQQGDQGHTDTISALAFSRDHIYLASASLDEKVIIWTVANGQEYVLLDPGRAIHSLAYTPDGKYLIGGAGDGTLHLWDAETYATVQTLHKNTAVVTFIIFSSDGRLMATGGMDRVCYIWETANLLAGEPLGVLEGHRGMVCAAAFSPDNSRIVTASDDNSSRIWNALTGEALVMLHEHTGQVCTVAFSPDGKRVASGSDDSTVKICDSYTGERLLSLDGHEQDSIINMVDFSPDGQYIASAASDSTVRLWNASDGTSQRTYNEHNANVAMVMFARDGSTLASGSHDGTVLIRPFMVPH